MTNSNDTDAAHTKKPMISVRVPAGEIETIKTTAAQLKTSVSQFIRNAIKKEVENTHAQANSK
jgi:predicted DNA binding CopG/RHH family protein